MKRERRRSVRLQVNIAAYFRFQNGEGEQVSISSLSEGGMAVRFAGVPGKRSGPIAFSFALPDTTTVIEATGTIAWQDSRQHAGIQFASLADASSDACPGCGRGNRAGCIQRSNRRGVRGVRHAGAAPRQAAG